MANVISAEFVEKMKATLTEEKAKLEKELGHIGTRDPKNPSGFVATFPDMGSGEDENAAEVASYSDNSAVGIELESALRDIISALARITKGSYGVCKYCSQEIDERRLLARPASASCITCKKRLTQEA